MFSQKQKVFLDEVDHIIMPKSQGGRDFEHCKLIAARKASTKQCFIDAMVQLTIWLASKGKWAVMSTKALQLQYPVVHRAQASVLNATRAFYY